MHYNKRFAIRLLNMVSGVFLYAFGIAMTIKANIGYAPWEVFHVGLALTTGMTIGAASIIAGIAVVVLVTALGEKFGLGTLASMILTGVFIDIVLWLDFIPVAKNFLAGIVMLFAGLFIISLGSYFYMKSAFGVGPRDNLMVALTRKTKIPVGLCRSTVELLMTFAGWLLGGKAGIGTIISMFAIGFCIQITFQALKFDVTAINHETLSDTYTALKNQQKERGK